MCCGSDMFGGCGCEGCSNPDCWPPEDDDDWEAPDDFETRHCDHEDADIDILTGRATCNMCERRWNATDAEMKRDEELRTRPYPGEDA